MNPKVKLFLFGACIGLGSLIYAQIPVKKALKTGRNTSINGVDSVFIERWSPRAMAGKAICDQDLMALFEAARWAPSSYNEQPWRFIYAKRGTPAWDRLFNLLVPFNQEWCKNGAALVVMISKKTASRGGLNQLHSFDTGSAWENLALQGSFKGLVVHGMGGFDYEKARAVLGIPSDYAVEAMCVIGHPAPADVLPDYLREMEKPSDRKSLDQIVAEGSFAFKE